MYEFLSKRGSTIALIVGLAIVVIYLGIVGSGAGVVDTTPKENWGEISVFNFGLYSVIVLLIICIAAAVLFSIYHVFANFKSSLTGLMGLAVIIIIFLIAYSMSAAVDSEKIGLLLQRFDVSEGLSKAISGGILTTIIMVLLALVSIIVAEIWNIFK